MLVVAVAILGAAIFAGILILDKKLDKEGRERLGYLGQWASGCLLGAAFGYEVATKAEIGYAAMSLGGLMYAAFTKLRRK